MDKATSSNEKKNKGLFDTSVLTIKAVLCIMFVSVGLVFVFFGVINRVDFMDDEPFQYIENWTVIDSDGSEYTTGRSFVDGKKRNQSCSIYSYLPSDIKDNEFLFFITRKDIAVYINGELRKDFVEERDVSIPGGSIKRFYMYVPLNAADSGAEVRMVRPSLVSDEHLVPETFISTRSGAFNHLLHNYDGLTFVLAFIILIFSFVVFIVSIFLRIWYKMNIYMMYGALGICVLSLWLITDSFLCPFIFGMYFVNGVMNYMLCLMIPLAPAVYLNSVQQNRYKKVFSVIMLVASLNAVVWTVLHFTGIVPFYEIRNIENIILSAMAVSAIVILVIDWVRGNVKGYRYTFIGFFGFLLCGILELALLLITTKTYTSLPVVAGLGFLLAFVVIQQVYDLRKINQEKQHAIDISEAKTRFLASMSHEIRTPINAILGMNEMILRENRDRVIGDYSRSIKTSGKMLLMLVNDVLDFSKIEAGKLEINETSFKMSEMLYDVISIVKERADEKSLELKTDITSEIPNELISDEFRIRQILVNLINNAVKYTEKGTVTLKLGGVYKKDDFELAITVKDTGKGIKKEEQADLFNAFSRADVKKNINIEGTGLGLAIVKSIVNSMKGTIGVESEYGVGSEFWVKLPVKYSDREPLRTDFMDKHEFFDDVPESESFMAPDAKILAVDDNQSNLTIVKLFLKRTGIKPDLCSSGDRAIELCRKTKYDLILLDHMMPQPDGIETLHLIKNDEASLNKDTKTVVLTANALAGSRQMYLDEGFDDYLSKPIDSKVLEQTVKNMLPKEKVIEGLSLAEVSSLSDDGQVVELNPGTESVIYEFQPEDESPVKKGLTAIEGLDYDTALCHCAGDEEMLLEIISDIVADCPKRYERMKKSLEMKDIKAYEVDVHSVKSTMATIGLGVLSERARKHEFAAKENDIEFILRDSEAFFNEYMEIYKKLKRIV